MQLKTHLSAKTGRRSRCTLEHGGTAVDNLGLALLPLPALTLLTVLLFLPLLLVGIIGLIALFSLFVVIGIIRSRSSLGSTFLSLSHLGSLLLLLLLLLLGSLGGGPGLLLFLLHLEVELLELLGRIDGARRPKGVGLGLGLAGRRLCWLGAVLLLALLGGLLRRQGRRGRPLGQVETGTGRGTCGR